MPNNMIISMDDLKKEILEWQKETFPLATKTNQMLKLEEEFAELNEAVDNNDSDKILEETADVVITSILLESLGSFLGQYVYSSILNKYLEDSQVFEFIKNEIQKKFKHNKNNRDFRWNPELGVYKGYDKK